MVHHSAFGPARFSAVAAVGLALLVGVAPASAASLGEAAELEHARANARAGGPVSDRDAELLERYGCLSGTRNEFCYALSDRSSDNRRYRKHRRHIER